MNEVLVTTNTAPVSAWTYRRLLWLMLFLWLSYVVGMSALVSHEMAAHPMAQAFADFMAQFIPMLDNIRKIPGSTEWVRFYYAGFWALAPIFLVLSWQVCNAYMAVKTMPKISVFRWILSCVVFGLMMVFMMYWPVADGQGWRDQSMATHIVGTAHHSLMMSFVFYLVGALLRGSYYFIFRGSPYWPLGSIK